MDQPPYRQREIYLQGGGGRRPLVPLDFEAMERACRKRLSPEAFGYLAGGAGRESTMQANRQAFERWCILPSMLRDVSCRDLSVELLGRKLPAPVLLCPVGALELAHPHADAAVARAARGLGLPMIFSNQASVPMEVCAAAMGDSPRWFQLYWSKSNELVESLVRRAEACGCEAIVVSVDTPLLGWRTRDLENGYLPFLRGRGLSQYFTDPVFQRLLDEPGAGAPDPDSPRPKGLGVLELLYQINRNYPGGLLTNLRSDRPLRAVRQFIRIYSRTTLTWKDLDFLRGITRLPVLLKGILTVEDAQRALDQGLDGIIVSNHGGRQVDGSITALDALDAISRALGDRLVLLFDSGIRHGADVFKALCLGARAVCLGRPFVYGLALAGEEGVREVLANLLADFELTMALSGCCSPAELGRQHLVAVP